jgi:hypothetical protein
MTSQHKLRSITQHAWTAAEAAIENHPGPSQLLLSLGVCVIRQTLNPANAG